MRLLSTSAIKFLQATGIFEDAIVVRHLDQPWLVHCLLCVREIIPISVFTDILIECNVILLHVSLLTLKLNGRNDRITVF